MLFFSVSAQCCHVYMYNVHVHVVYGDLYCLCILLVHCRQMQELESRFNEAYSQSLSMKDERIQVLERRIEDLTAENEQLKDEISLLKRQNERMQRRNAGSPNASFR